MVCEPIGAYLVDAFAPKLLTIDPSDPAAKAPLEDKGGNAEPEIKPEIKKDTDPEHKVEKIVNNASIAG